MNNPTYPELDFLEDEVKDILIKDKAFMEKLYALETKQTALFFQTHIDVYVFPQSWSCTHTGFDLLPDGSPNFRQNGAWKVYTTVFHEPSTGTYVVCFDNRPCYVVKSATEDFTADLRDHNLAPYSKAIHRYNAQEIYYKSITLGEK